MVTYQIRFCVDLSRIGESQHYKEEIQLEAVNDYSAKREFGHFCMQNPNGYMNYLYSQRPCLVRFEILAEM